MGARRADVGRRGEAGQQDNRVALGQRGLANRQRVHVVERRRDERPLGRLVGFLISGRRRISMTQRWLRCDSTTPFGRPLDPEV